MRLKGKVAVVTGASSGIGFAIAEKFIREGAKVIYADLNEITIGHPGDQAMFYKCDVTDRVSVETMIAETVSRFGRVDIMVNNAGVGTSGGILDVTDEMWEKTIKTNLFGVFYGVQAAAKSMKENSVAGSIINMSSILGDVGLPGSVAYCAAKGGVVQLTRAAALDLAPHSIRVNAIAPGFIRTNMTRDFLANEEFRQMVEAGTPLGYAGDPGDIAHGAVYLGSDESRYVTGETLFIDGGWRAR